MLDTGSTHVIFQGGNVVARQTIGIFIDNSSQLRVYFHDNDFILPPITANTWYHICYSYSGGVLSHSTVKTYLNGTKLTGTHSVSNAGALNLTNFNFSINGNNNGDYITEPSHIANFRIFNRALSSDEIYQLYAYQKEDFGHSTNNMTLKAGRLGIGTSKPRGALDVHGDIYGGCPVYFAAYTTSTSTTTNKTIPWNNLWISRGGGFDTSTGKFTVPLAGVYKFFCALRHPDGVNTSSYARFQLNDSDISVSYGSIYLGQVRDMGSGMVLLKLNVGDVVSVKIFNYHIASNYNSFVGEYFSSL